MLKNLSLIVANAVEEPGTLEVVIMGMGVVFIGLIAIVIICKLTGKICMSFSNKEKTEEKPEAPKTTVNIPIENKEEIIAAVCAAAAEELGTDVSALRVRSFKRI